MEVGPFRRGLFRRRESAESNGGADKCNDTKEEQQLMRSPSLSESLKTPAAATWLKRIIYQVCFSASLTAFFGLLLGLYCLTLHPFHPRMRTGGANVSSSVLSFNQPALGFRPRPEDRLSTLIRFQHGYSSSDWEPHYVTAQSIRNFLKRSSRGKNFGTHIKCNWYTQLGDDVPCHVSNRKRIDWTLDTACTKAEKFGYPRGKPCVVIKINRVFGWEPEPYYNLTEIQEHPTMPKFLKESIESTWTKKCQGKGAEKESRCPNLRMAWVTCEGATPHDHEYMGPVSYMPTHGLEGFNYPYLNQQLYLTPYIFVQFHNLTPGVVVSVHCKIWAKNVAHDPRNPRVGGVQFELLMD